MRAVGVVSSCGEVLVAFLKYFYLKNESKLKNAPWKSKIFTSNQVDTNRRNCNVQPNFLLFSPFFTDIDGVFRYFAERYRSDRKYKDHYI